jgi:hypothetical protein
MYGRNSNSVANASAPDGTDQALDFTGGFVQGDYSVRDNLQLTLRVNAVHRPVRLEPSDTETFANVFPGIRVFVRERLRLVFEYGFQNQDRANIGAVQAELAF